VLFAEKLRVGADNHAVLARQGRYQQVDDHLQVKEVRLGSDVVGAGVPDRRPGRWQRASRRPARRTPGPDEVSVPQVEDCEPARPVRVVTFHGVPGPINPTRATAAGAGAARCRSRPQTWARLNGCRRGPYATTISAHVTRLGYTCCEQGAVVVLYRIADGGTPGPGAATRCLPGSASSPARSTPPGSCGASSSTTGCVNAERPWAARARRAGQGVAHAGCLGGIAAMGQCRPTDVLYRWLVGRREAKKRYRTA
jgi:hypothetical protein